MTKVKNLWIFNENKLLILESLYNCQKGNKVCGCDLVDKLKLPKNLVSYHIKSLKEGDLIEEVKCGRNSQYQIKKDKVQEIKKILNITGLVK